MEVKNYKIIKSLKKTSKWELFLAHHINNNKLLVKIRIFNSTLTSNEDAQKKLISSLEYFYTFRSSHIISLLDYGYLDKNTIYEVIEHLDYLNLRELLNKTKKIPQEIAAIILKEILIGLSQAHAREIYHGHLNPNLICSSSSGIIKIQDFAYPINYHSFNHFLCTETPFSNLYYSPEHLLKRPITKCTDFFLLGILSYEMITGKHPFWKAEKPWDPYKILSDNHEPLFFYLPNINPTLEKVIEKMLNKNPDERYNDASEAIEDLNPYILSLGPYKSYEILSNFFIDPKLATSQINNISLENIFDIARREFFSKNYKKALFLFQTLKKLEANFDGLDIYINDIKESKGLSNINEASLKLIADYKSKLETQPNNLSYLSKLMLLNKEIGNYLEAIYYSKKILQLEPSNEKALDVISEFIPSEIKKYEISTTFTKTLSSTFRKDEESEQIEMPLYKKLSIAVIMLGIIILLMQQFHWINFNEAINNVMAFTPTPANYNKIASELSNMENRFHKNPSNKELQQMIIKLQNLHRQDFTEDYSCEIYLLLSKSYIKLDKFYKSKFYIDKLKESCEDIDRIKDALIEYGRYLEDKGNLSLALDNYLELMLKINYQDKNYKMLEEKVKILQKRILLALQIKAPSQ